VFRKADHNICHCAMYLSSRIEELSKPMRSLKESRHRVTLESSRQVLLEVMGGAGAYWVPVWVAGGAIVENLRDLVLQPSN